MSHRFPVLLVVLGTSAGRWAHGAPPVVHEMPLIQRPAAGDVPPERTSPAPPDDPADTCGIVSEPAPQFQLEDVNPSSPTFGMMVDRTSVPGDVTLLYIALASCGHCQSDTDQLGALVQEQGDRWSEVSVRIVALNAALEDLPVLADGHDLPILVDTPTVDIEGQYGADRWYVYLLDRAGIPRVLHYDVDFYVERDRLVGEVDALLAEARP